MEIIAAEFKVKAAELVEIALAVANLPSLQIISIDQRLPRYGQPRSTRIK